MRETELWTLLPIQADHFLFCRWSVGEDATIPCPPPLSPFPPSCSGGSRDGPSPRSWAIVSSVMYLCDGGWGGEESSAEITSAQPGRAVTPSCLPFLHQHFGAAALAQPGLDLIDSLWPADSMPEPNTCGRQARVEVGERRSKGEQRGPDPNSRKTQGFPRSGPDHDPHARRTHMPMTLVSRIVLDLISQQCPIEWECLRPGPSDGTSLGQTPSRKNVM